MDCCATAAPPLPEPCYSESGLLPADALDAAPLKVGIEMIDWGSWSIWGLPKPKVSDEPEKGSPRDYEKMESDDENMPEETTDEDDNDFLGGESDPKRRKLDFDPISMISTAERERWLLHLKLLHAKQPDPEEILEFITSLSNCDIKHDSVSEDILKNLRQRNLVKPAFPDDCIPLSWIHKRIDFHQKIFNIRALHEAVKSLYLCVPYVKGSEIFEEVRQMTRLNPTAFAHLQDYEIYEAYWIYQNSLRKAEFFFNPLLRKSYKEEFETLVDTMAKLAECEFIMLNWRHELIRDSVMLKLSCGKDLRDKEYEHCCEQIRLQERFDDYLHLCQKVTHNCLVEDLIHDEAIVTKEFKYLNPELIRLSLEACIKNRRLDEEVNQCFLQLQSLEDAHRKKETCDIDDMLKALHHDFPYILDFPNDKPVDDDLEQRFKSAMHKIKEMWFPRIADHYVVEAILVYIKHLVLKSDGDDSNWPTRYLKARRFYLRAPRPLCHVHYVYERVLGVEYSLA